MVHMVRAFFFLFLFFLKYKSIQEYEKYLSRQAKLEENFILFYVYNAVVNFIIIEMPSLLIINNKLMLMINQKRTNKNPPIKLL